MEQRINIAELLKDCPIGMELDCTIYENVTFEYVVKSSSLPIRIKIQDRGTMFLSRYGQLHDEKCCKCVIFPKGKTTWEGFVPPCEFKNGDIIVNKFGDIHLLRTKDSSYCAYRERWEELSKFDSTLTTAIQVERLATEEERQKLFNAIKENGYRWNAETKTLEELIEPEFKIGDKIKHKNGKDKNGVEQGLILSITDDTYDIAVTNDMGIFVPIADQNEWELVPNKFDINTLVPFESRILVRVLNGNLWRPAIFGFFSHAGGCYVIGGGYWQQYIPYEGNEHLIGTTDDCDEYYKTW